MPQLNPNPWFLMFILSWAALLIYKTKALSIPPTTSPTTTDTGTTKQTTPWGWPWI